MGALVNQTFKFIWNWTDDPRQNAIIYSCFWFFVTDRVQVLIVRNNIVVICKDTGYVVRRNTSASDHWLTHPPCRLFTLIVSCSCSQNEVRQAFTITKILIFFRDKLVPKYKSLQVSVTTESPDLSEMLLSFKNYVPAKRYIFIVVWYICNDDGDWTTTVKHLACSLIVTKQATEHWVWWSFIETHECPEKL